MYNYNYLGPLTSTGRFDTNSKLFVVSPIGPASYLFEHISRIRIERFQSESYFHLEIREILHTRVHLVIRQINTAL